jgi:23S rRNA (guanosine2251-2'-O)-methyltransferase
MWESDLPEKMLLVMGSEGSGLSRLVRETCDLHVSIPMHGTTESLNVGQATTAIAYEWLRRGSG